MNKSFSVIVCVPPKKSQVLVFAPSCPTVLASIVVFLPVPIVNKVAGAYSDQHIVSASSQMAICGLFHDVVWIAFTHLCKLHSHRPKP